MKLAILISFAFALPCCAKPVVVCTSGGSRVMVSAATAQQIAGQMFRRIGVDLEWRMASRSCPANGIVIELTTYTPADLHPLALAYAMPFEGTRVRVYFDRVRLRAGDSLAREYALLAHVLAHEIAHILQGTDTHSPTGVMKARWDRQDYDQMTRRDRLPFAPVDVLLIQRGLEVRLAASLYN